MDKRDDFYGKLDYDKIKINHNDNPIEMSLFLSFLTVDVERSTGHIGYTNGWTELNNRSIELTVKGGVVGGVEYLESLQYKKDLHNPYNNWVTPFNMLEILTKEGREFFLDYYKDDFSKLCKNADDNIDILNSKLRIARSLKKNILNEIELLNGGVIIPKTLK